MKENQGRDSNIEILRLLSMFLIVLGHQATHGFEVALLPCNGTGIFTIAMSQGARIAVDVFVLITGYYSTVQTIKWPKFFSVYRQVWFYSVIVLLFCWTFLNEQLSLSVVLKSTFPAYTSQYWFASCFLYLMLLLPYINILIENINRRQHEILLAILLVPFCLIPTLIPINTPLYSNLIWFVVLILIASYIRKYPPTQIAHIKWWHGILVLITLMLITSTIWSVGNSSAYIRYNAIYLLAEPNKLTALICAILLFVGFKNTEMGRNKWINSISANVFAVYLLTDHPQIRKYIFMPVTTQIDSEWYPILYFGWVLFLMVLAIFIDKIRMKIDNFIFRKSK